MNFHAGTRAIPPAAAAWRAGTPMELTFTRLTEVAAADIVALHADPRVRRHLPLATGRFGLADCRRWLADKEALWHRHGYGPWAILADGRFVGWGGLQPEDGDADLALVLAPRGWGLGRAICRAVLRVAFDELGLDSVTARLPTSRVRLGALDRMGFRPDGEVEVAGIVFRRFRLSAAAAAGHGLAGARPREPATR